MTSCRFLSAVVVVILLGGFSSAAFSQVLVSFPDAALEAEIRLAISKPTGDIYDTDRQTLTDLLAAASGISDPAGLEHCTNSAELRLSSNEVSDISPLVRISNLVSTPRWRTDLGQRARFSISQ